MTGPDRRALAGWAVVLAGLQFALPGLTAAPGRDAVQLAYDAAKAETGVRHRDDLKIRDADCSALPGHRYACQIDFVRAAEPDGRLYFTVVTLERRATAWMLIGGLCRDGGWR